MQRTGRSDVHSLVEEVRSLEILASETAVAPNRVEDYWSVSTDLLALTLDIEELQQLDPTAGADQPEMLALRRRARQIASRLTEFALEAADE